MAADGEDFICLCGVCQLLPCSDVLDVKCGTALQACPFVKQITQLCQAASARTSTTHPNRQGANALPYADSGGGTPVEIDAGSKIAFTISIGASNDDPASTHFIVVPSQVTTAMCRWFMSNLDNFGPRPEEPCSPDQLRRCCYVVQVGERTPTSPRKLHLACLLIDVFQAIIAECDEPQSPVLTQTIICKILLLWLPSITCDICGIVATRPTSDAFLPFKGCYICGQSPATHHSACCAGQKEVAHPQFADFRGSREFITLLQSKLSPAAFRAFNHSTFAGSILRYTPYVMSQFLDPS